MKFALMIPIECGKETCGDEPGEWCTYFSSCKFGRNSICALPDENRSVHKPGNQRRMDTAMRRLQSSLDRAASATVIFDVVELSIAKPHRVRVLATGKDADSAEAVIAIAIALRGVDEAIFTKVPAGRYKDGDVVDFEDR